MPLARLHPWGKPSSRRIASLLSPFSRLTLTPAISATLDICCRGRVFKTFPTWVRFTWDPPSPTRDERRFLGSLHRSFTMPLPLGSLSKPMQNHSEWQNCLKFFDIIYLPQVPLPACCNLWLSSFKICGALEGYICCLRPLLSPTSPSCASSGSGCNRPIGPLVAGRLPPSCLWINQGDVG